MALKLKQRNARFVNKFKKRHRLASQMNRDVVLQVKKDLRETLLDSEAEVAELTVKLGVSTKRIQQQDKILALREDTIKSLTDKRDELYGLLDAQKAARARDRPQEIYLEKGPQ